MRYITLGAATIGAGILGFELLRLLFGGHSFGIAEGQALLVLAVATHVIGGKS